MKRKRKGDISGNTSTLEKFIKSKNTIDILALYLVYESTCHFEGCPSEQMTDEEAIGILKWSEPKFYRVKQKLITFGLIEINKEEVTYTYIHVNYLMQ